jgi:hypothetical protein
MDSIMLVVALVAFAVLVAGWMILPGAPAKNAADEMPAAMPASRAA